MRSMVVLLTGAALLVACDGAAENAGEVADADAGQAVAIGEGPNERLGASVDRASDAAEEAVEAQADLIRDRADLKADELDAQADRLEGQADAMRERAKQTADAIEDRASR